LDLNRGATGGLLLSNVALTNLSVIPANTFVGISTQQDTNQELAGMIVYNTDATTGIGIYVWDGDDWIKPCAPPAPGQITFSGPSCLVTAGVAPVPGATSYEWTLPQGLTITGAPDGATITIIGTAATYPIGSITVRAVSSCGGGTRRESAQPVTLLGAPAAPGAITFSDTKICGVGSTFTASVAPVPEATSYVWTLPNGLSPLVASDATTITIGWTIEGVYSAGLISVQAVNSCGAAGAPSSSTQLVTVGAPPAPPTGGSASSTDNTTFTFSATPASGCTINWYATASGGSPISGGSQTNSVTVANITTTTSYYAESYNATTGCVSASRLEVKAVTIRSVYGCATKPSYGASVITPANVDFINDAEYARNGITLSAPVKIVGRADRMVLKDDYTFSLVDYRDHQVSDTDATINTADYGSWFTWCMVATHADILCPSPWRVPTYEDFCQYANGSPSSTGTTTEVKSGMHGWLLGGYAYDSSTADIGVFGLYWSSTESSSNANGGHGVTVAISSFDPSESSDRYYGLSLRCVR
jgi:uncharacterized protein (TIGR02145 family)